MNARVYPNRESWLASRDALSIGASEAAQALGVSPYGGPWELYERKQGKATPDNTAMARGRKWESRVLEDYAEEAGVQVIDPAIHLSGRNGIAVLHHPDHDWMRCSPDAFTRQNGILAGAEAKTATDSGAWTPEKGLVLDRWSDDAATLIPAHYAVQVYFSLEVSGFPYWDLCALVPAGGWLEVRWVRIMRDVPTQSSIVATLAEWQDRHLVKGIPPEIDGSDACNRALSVTFKKKKSRESTYEEMGLLYELASIKNQEKQLKERGDLIKNTLIQKADGNRLYALGASGAYGQPQYNQGRKLLDIFRLQTEFPEAWEACQKQGQPYVSFNLYKFDKE